ncbi:MAG: NAD(P)H-quinone oxidoreductase [Clostridiales bacterium]|nr:NAD(P)H-quinone oxidoreductase [Clostridiales bacterium]
MKAILVNSDRSLSWSDVPDPVIKPDEALVKIHAAGINRADLMQREGNYPPPPGCPEWMGLEVSGEIVALGSECARWSIGDKVCALLGGGGYAEYVAVRHDMLMSVPEGVTMEEAAAIPEAFATAYLNMFLEGKAKSGDTLLMNAGASGLASVVIPMAKAFGLRVITTVREDSDVEAIGHLGADIIVQTKRESITEALKCEYEAGRGVDITIDCLGGEIMGKCLHFLSHGARWIMIATLAGAVTEIDLANVFRRNVRVIGSTLRSRAPSFKAELLASLERDVWPKVTTGEVRPTIYKILPITEAEAAQNILYTGENVGKVVLKVI